MLCLILTFAFETFFSIATTVDSWAVFTQKFIKKINVYK